MLETRKLFTNVTCVVEARGVCALSVAPRGSASRSRGSFVRDGDVWLVCSSSEGEKEPPRRAETQERGKSFYDSTAAREQTI